MSVLPKLLEQVLKRNWRAVVLTGSEERVEALNSQLWTYNNHSFLPHGSGLDGYREHQPIWITSVDENPNQSNVLFLTDGSRTDNVNLYSLCCELFDGSDDDTLEVARARWKNYRSAGHKLTYYKQKHTGGWKLKSHVND